MASVDPVERVLNLLALLHEAGGPLTRAEIVMRMSTGSTPYPADPAALHQQFSVDRRTITSVLDVGIHQRVRSGTDAGATEYWLDPADVHLPALDLDDEEQVVLALALGAVRRSLPWAGEAALKLGHTSPDRSDPPIDLALRVPETVIRVVDAIRRSVVLGFDVDSDAAADDDADQRLAGDRGTVHLEPWSVVLEGGAWYVIGRPVTDEEPVAVRLTSRTRPVLTDRPVGERPRGVLDRELVNRLVGSADTAPVRARVRADHDAAVRASLSPMVVGRTSETDGTVLLDVVVTDPDRFQGWLVDLGDRAVVESPEQVRHAFIERLRKIADHVPEHRPAPPRPPSVGARRPGPEPAAARLHRVLSIVPWLYRQGSVRVAEIADRIGASEARVVRDLTIASMCGVPPYTADALFGFWVEPGPDGDVVHVLGSNLLSEPVRLTARQAAAVAVALSAIGALPGTDLVAVERLRRRLDDALGGVDVRVRLEEPPLLDAIRTAVEHGERLRIRYVDLDDDVTEREVDPLKLFVDRGRAYVYTDDHLRGAPRVFRVDRILEAEPTGERFDPRPVTPPAGSSWEWMVPDREVVVRLPPGSEVVLDRNATLAHVISDDGSVVAWLSVVSESWLANLLVRCGPGAEVLEPEDLTDLARRRAVQQLSRYGAG